MILRERGVEGSGDQVADFFLEAAEDTRLGLAVGGRAHAQGGRYLGRSLILDGGPPEGLPGVALEVAADQLQGAVVDIAELRGVAGIVRKGSRGNFLEQTVDIRAALGRRLALAALVEITQLVTRNGSQPAAERPRGLWARGGGRGVRPAAPCRSRLRCISAARFFRVTPGRL